MIEIRIILNIKPDSTEWIIQSFSAWSDKKNILNLLLCITFSIFTMQWILRFLS